jgi:hypothetical protein
LICYPIFNFLQFLKIVNLLLVLFNTLHILHHLALEIVLICVLSGVHLLTHHLLLFCTSALSLLICRFYLLLQFLKFLQIFHLGLNEFCLVLFTHQVLKVFLLDGFFGLFLWRGFLNDGYLLCWLLLLILITRRGSLD